MPRTKKEQSDIKEEIAVGQRINDLRTLNGETQAQLAKAIGISKRETINRYESATSGIPCRDIIKIARHYNVSADYLLGLSNVKKPDTTTQAICEKTHLSESAIEKLSQFIVRTNILKGRYSAKKDVDVQPYFRKAFSDFISCDYFDDFADWLTRYAIRSEDFLRYGKEKNFDAVSLLDLTGYIDVNELSLFEYKLSKALTKILDNIFSTDKISSYYKQINDELTKASQEEEEWLQ